MNLQTRIVPTLDTLYQTDKSRDCQPEKILVSIRPDSSTVPSHSQQAVYPAVTGLTRGKYIGGPTLVVGAPDEPKVAKRVRETGLRGKLSAESAREKRLPVELVGDKESNELWRSISWCAHIMSGTSGLLQLGCTPE